MLQLLCLATTLAVAVIPAVTKIAFSGPISTSSQYPEVQKFNNVNVPLCYIQTTDAKTLDLYKLCSKIFRLIGLIKIYPAVFQKQSFAAAQEVVMPLIGCN